MNQVGVLGDGSLSRKSLKLVFKLLHFLVY
jgi:hypothetical protein